MVGGVHAAIIAGVVLVAGLIGVQEVGKAQTFIEGYFRQDGTYVRPHFRYYRSAHPPASPEARGMVVPECGPASLASSRAMQAARELHTRNPYEFERWAISLVEGLFSNRRQRGDGGVDGRGYLSYRGEIYLVLAQVKGGKRPIGPAAIRAFSGVIEHAQATSGILIVFSRQSLTRGSWLEIYERNRDAFPMVVGQRLLPYLQVWSVEELMCQPVTLIGKLYD